MRVCNARVFFAALLFVLTISNPNQPTAQPTPLLLLTVVPLGAAAGDKPVPVEAIIEFDVVLKNQTGALISDVRLIANLGGMTLAPESEWRMEGDSAVLTIASAVDTEEVSRRLRLRVPAAPLPPGKQTAIAVEARTGEAAAKASAKFQIADCAAAFQADLTKLRISTISDIWPTAENMRKPDTSLPRGRYFRVGVRKNRDLAILDRLAAGYQARLLSDYEFFREGVRYTARRWSDELKAFAGQDVNPGICAVNHEMIEGVRKTINYVTVRLESPQKAYQKGVEQLRKELNAGKDEDLRRIALRIAEEAGVKLDNPPASIFEILERTRDQLKDLKPTLQQLDDLSLIESAAWVEAQALRAKKLSDLIENSITGIVDAKKKNCVCAF